MQELEFSAAVEQIIGKDPRFEREAYHFLKEAIEYTVSDGKKVRNIRPKHVTGQQLLDGVRRYAIEQFGPMVPTVFQYWGLEKCEHIGEVVYNLIRSGCFRKSEQDSQEDFSGGYSFYDAFVLPFLPSRAPIPQPSKISKRGQRAPRGSKES
jgi:uncharacterized repeat protein (TIGR04138 family)